MDPRDLPIRDRIYLRHRGAGHVRFDLPEELCDPSAAQALKQRLGRTEGIYRIVVYPSSRKLSVRYQETVCGFRDVALALYAAAPVALRDAARAVRSPTTAQPPPESLKQKLLAHPVVAGLHERYTRAKQTVTAMTALARQRLSTQQATPMTNEKLAINFLNDLVAFYLIKVHWSRITSQWLRAPWTYRYQWLTLSYLTFLLIRYRKSGPK
jgi:hypothetical protein